jgi:hypothetical protein
MVRSIDADKKWKGSALVELHWSVKWDLTANTLVSATHGQADVVIGLKRRENAGEGR